MGYFAAFPPPHTHCSPPALVAIGIHGKWAHIGSPARWNKSRSKREAAAELRQELPAALAASAVVLGQGFRGSWEAYAAAFDAGAGVVRISRLRPVCVCVCLCLCFRMDTEGH